MSNKIYKKLIIGEIEEITEIQDTVKILVSAENGEIKEVDKSQVGVTENRINEIITTSSEFTKNGGGWSLRYRLDNPSFYGVIGSEAIDLSISKSANTTMPERFSYGANGFNSIVFGIYNSAMDAGSLVSGVQNRSQGQCNNIMSSNSTIIQDKGTGNFTKKDNGIYSGNNNTIENNRSSIIIGGGNNKMVGKISPVNSMYDMYNAIIGGNYNTLTNSISNIILGGTLNDIIGEEKSRENESYNSNNAIIGGYKNKIITATGTNRQAYGSVIFGGEENIAQGHYNMIAGYGNHAVTAGEVLVGIFGTIQNTSLSGYDFISNSRMFNVGIGFSNTQGVATRKDGLSVFRNGLVTAPSLTSTLIDSNNKSLVTKEYVETKQSFIINSTGGYSHKYRKDNPTKYTGEVASNSIDLTFSNLDTTTGIKGTDSFGVGVNNIAHSTSSLMLAYNSLTFAPNTGVFGGEGNMIGYGGDIDNLESTTQFTYIYGGKSNNIINGGTSSIVGGNSNTIGSVMQTSGVWDSNTLVGGESNTIIMSENSSIIGGADNRIATNTPKTFEENSKNGYNTIIGGKANSIVSSSMGVRPAFASVILGGESNNAQGYYNVVGGKGNYAVTLGESMFGIYGTQQPTFLSGYNRLPTARIFNIGVGTIDTPADGLSVFVNGLISAPSITNELINSNNKALTTNEWVKNEIANYPYPIFKDNDSGGFAISERLLAPLAYGQLGGKALDFSHTTPLIQGAYGATGEYSFAHGLDVKSEGYASVTFGRKNTNSGSFTIVNGEENIITGDKQIVAGLKNKSAVMNGLVVGSNNNVYGQECLIVGRGIDKENVDTESIIGWYNKDFEGNETERVFTVANGTSNEERSNALIVYKNGLISAPSSTNELIDADTTNKSLVTKDYLNATTIIKVLTSATTEQKNQIKTLLGL